MGPLRRNCAGPTGTDEGGLVSPLKRQITRCHDQPFDQITTGHPTRGASHLSALLERFSAGASAWHRAGARSDGRPAVGDRSGAAVPTHAVQHRGIGHRLPGLSPATPWLARNATCRSPAPFEMEPLFLSILGAPACGKSYFLAAMTWRLRTRRRNTSAWCLATPTPVSNHRLHEYEEIQSPIPIRTPW